MFEAFAPLMTLIIIYFFIALIVKAAKKASSASPKAPGAPAAPAAPKASAPQPAEQPQIRELQPTVRPYNHDDSLYRGSLNAVTGEGYDPCHEEQLAPLTYLETAEPVQTAAPPALQLNWTGDEIVRGLVISEILKRKGA